MSNTVICKWTPCRNRPFPDMHAFRQHEMDSKDHKRCDHCEEQFDSCDELKRHWKESPPTVHPYCPKCDLYFGESEKDLRQHILGLDDHCKLCSSVLKNSTGVHQHCMMKHPAQYCVGCKEPFSSESNCRSHWNSHKHQNFKFECQGCGHRSRSYNAFFQHIEKVRKGCSAKASQNKIHGTVRKRDVRQLVISVTSQGIAYRCPLGECCQGRKFNAFSSLCQHVEQAQGVGNLDEDVADLFDAVRAFFMRSKS